MVFFFFIYSVQKNNFTGTVAWSSFICINSNNFHKWLEPQYKYNADEYIEYVNETSSNKKEEKKE